MYLTKLASVQLVLWNILQQYNQDPAVVFRKAGLKIDQMHKPGARYSLDRINALWEGMAKVIPDPCFGITAATNWHPSNFGTLGYAMLSSPSLRVTLERLVRFHKVISDAHFGEFHEDQDKGTLVFNLVYEDENPYLQAREDAALAMIMSGLRMNYQQKLDPVSVSFTHNRPDCASKYYEYFRSPVIFGAETSSLSLSLDVVDRVLPSGNEKLASFSDQAMTQYLASLDEAVHLISRVQKCIVERLPSGDATGENVASELSLSTRSLQRTLQQEGTTFIAILNDTRRDIARQYVLEDTIDLTEIAFLLGFSTLSSFSRSFKRWTGKSPVQYRKAA